MSRAARATEAGGLLLVARSALFSGVAVALAGAAHTIAGGASPSALLLAGAFVVLTQLVVLLMPRERGFLPVVTLLIVSQLVLHVVFGSFHAQHHLSGADGSLLSRGIGPMGWGHLVAVLGAAWWLRRGEAHAWRLARGAVCALTRRLLTALRAVGGPQLVQKSLSSVRVAGHSRALMSRIPRASVRRRGPPVGAVVSPG